MAKLLNVLFSLLFCFIILQFVSSETTLKQVHVIFRHGARTPGKSNSYPKDPYLNETWYPYGIGQLTNSGKHDEHKLGADLRKRYDELLGHIYSPDIVYARSTSYDRTKQSLQLVLAGLWPPVTVQQWDSFVGKIWQPVSYDYVPYDSDKLLGFPIWSCKEVAEEYKRVSTIPIQQFMKNNLGLVNFVNEKTGLNITSTEQIMELYIGFLALQREEKPIPEWANNISLFLRTASEFEYEIQTSSQLIVRESGGPVVKKILDDIQSGIKNNKFLPKISLYSAHEYNIAYVLSVLQNYKPHVPDFSSCIVLELHNINNKYKIKVLYRENSMHEFEVLTIPGCEKLCELDKFKTITKKYVPDKQIC